MATESFTYMSDEAVSAIQGRLMDGFPAGEKYDMSLNRSDMSRLVYALRDAYQHSTHVEDVQISGLRCSPETCTACWAGDFVSSIGTTLGVEMV